MWLLIEGVKAGVKEGAKSLWFDDPAVVFL